MDQSKVLSYDICFEVMFTHYLLLLSFLYMKHQEHGSLFVVDYDCDYQACAWHAME